MRRDVHFHLTYLLLRHAGIKKDLAQVIAYACEHVDNQKSPHVIPFINGGQTQTYRSAHRFLSRHMYTDRSGLAIYMPFHFFPCLEGESFYDKIRCLPRSQGIQALKSNLLDHIHKAYGPHLLGIGLHVIEDTYAHQGFVALRDRSNRVKDMAIDNHVFMDVLYRVKPFFLPAFSHLQALTCPDEPACQWSYTDYQGRRIHRNNIDDYMEAVEEVYDFLQADVFKAKPSWFDTKPRDLDLIRDSIYKLLDIKQSCQNRLKVWETVWDLDFFTGIERPIYQEDQWFSEAIQEKNYWLFKSYKRQVPYAQSHWKYFQDALAAHLYYCKHDLFPGHGIFI